MNAPNKNQICLFSFKYEPNGLESPDQVRKLFYLSKFVMQVKSVQAEVALEELEVMAKKQRQFSTGPTKQMEQTDSFDWGRTLQGENEQLKSSLQKTENELLQCKEQNATLQNEAETSRRKLQDVNAELDQLKEEITNERQQWNEQLAQSEMPFQKLREMNAKFASVLEQLKRCELSNEHLNEECASLQSELNAATVQIRIASGRLSNQQKVAQRLHNLNAQLLSEKEHLEQECNIYEELVTQLEHKESPNGPPSSNQCFGKKMSFDKDEQIGVF